MFQFYIQFTLSADGVVDISLHGRPAPTVSLLRSTRCETQRLRQIRRSAASSGNLISRTSQKLMTRSNRSRSRICARQYRVWWCKVVRFVTHALKKLQDLLWSCKATSCLHALLFSLTLAGRQDLSRNTTKGRVL